jgi:hypothetical protein
MMSREYSAISAAFDVAADLAMMALDEVAFGRAIWKYRRDLRVFAAKLPTTAADAADKLEVLLSERGSVAVLQPLAQTLKEIVSDLRSDRNIPDMAGRIRNLHKEVVAIAGDGSFQALLIGSVLAGLTRPRLATGSAA